MQHLQQEDMLHFGQLLLSLACCSQTAVHHLQRSLDVISRRYTADIRRIILYLLSRPTPTKNLDEVATMCGPKLLQEIDLSHTYVESFHGFYFRL